MPLCHYATMPRGDAASLPMGDSSFDAVTIGFGLLHLPQPHLALAEACDRRHPRLQPHGTEGCNHTYRGCNPPAPTEAWFHA